MAKIKQDDVLNKITPDEIDDVVLPSLKTKKNKTTKSEEPKKEIIEPKKEPKKSLKAVLEKVYEEELEENKEEVKNVKSIFDDTQVLPITNNIENNKNKEEKEKVIFDRKFVARKIPKDKLIVFLVMLIFIGVGVYSGVQIVLWKIDSDKTLKQIDTINETVVIEEIEDTDATEIINPPVVEDESNPYWDYIKMSLINVDFTELLKINSDTKGWLQVSGTNINYPFVQTTDNEYYLKRDFNKESNSAGWVFLDYRNDINNLDRNTILYAHGRINGTMFGSLKNIFNTNWFDNPDNHVIKLSTSTENTLWQVFSVYSIPTTSDYLQTEFSSSEEFLEFATMLEERSRYDFNATLNAEDHILTLSTCLNDSERVVLHAKLIKKEVR